MKVIRADYVMRMDEGFAILRDGAVAFDARIRAVGPAKVVRDAYPDAEFVDAGARSVLLPGLVNVHVHLEFSANKTTLAYGDFIRWLGSVIRHREALSGKCRAICMKKVLDQMIASGTTTIGAVSSYGADLQACVHSPMRVVYFNEVLGSNPAMVDALFGDFLQRLQESKKAAREGFVPAISVHSPYSTHPILAQKALAIAKEEGMVVSTHFMESRAEREWLESGSGDFAGFFAKFMPGSRPVNTPMAYIRLFEGVPTLFTHAVHATEEEIAAMEAIGVITHCPVSNRLLGNGRLEIGHLKRLTLGTDGLSSNISLNLWDEMRAALMMHAQMPLNALARRLLLAATSEGAAALGQNSGVLETFKEADMIVVQLPDDPQEREDLPLQLLLHTKTAKMVYIGGELQHS